jgi:single-strand DNA-binding protein
MTIVGRITRDAVINKLKDEREVVNFSIAVNDFYKSRNGESVKAVSYYNCSYWLSAKIAERLKKGCLVELQGRIYVSAYKDMNENVKACQPDQNSWNTQRSRTVRKVSRDEGRGRQKR